MKQTRKGGFMGEFHANKERVIQELLRGKESATRLRSVLRGPLSGDGPPQAHQLALQIVRSFTEALSEMGLSGQIAAVDCGGSASLGGCGKKGPTAVKERRGCYKRRRTSDARVVESSTTEDGGAWRKYGQKEIMNSNYPRCYFRCSHKYDGCKAIKQVQMIKDNPITYQTTYFNSHTCNKQVNPNVFLDSDPIDPNLISFESNIIEQKRDHCSPISTIIQATKDHQAQGDQDLSSDEGKSTLQDPWQDIDDRLEPLDYKSERDIGGLYELDEEVNQLDDIDYSWCSDLM